MCTKQLVYLGLSASALLAACGTGDSVRLGSVHVKSQQIDAKTGGLIAVEAADGAPRLVGTKIQIPADALSASTKITIGISAADVVDQDSEAAGPVVDFGPDGTHFATPVRITLPYEGAADVDLFRVFVVQSNGDRQVLLPEDVEYDAAAKTVTFSIDHFTRFQPGRGRHPCAHVQCPNNMCRRGHCTGGACSNPNSCGPRPASPSWICENGSTGGYTGRCLADAMGQCSWEVNNCPRACEPMECGPRPARPNITCADGTTIAGPGDCRRRADGTCSWDIITCPVACQADSDCPPNQACNNGVCGGITMGCRADSDCAQGSFSALLRARALGPHRPTLGRGDGDPPVLGVAPILGARPAGRVARKEIAGAGSQEEVHPRIRTGLRPRLVLVVTGEPQAVERRPRGREAHQLAVGARTDGCASVEAGLRL